MRRTVATLLAGLALAVVGCSPDSATTTSTVPGSSTTLPPATTLPPLPIPTVATVNACALVRASEIEELVEDAGEGEAVDNPGGEPGSNPALFAAGCAWPSLEHSELELYYLAPTTATDGASHLQDVLEVDTGFAEGGRVLAEDQGAESVGILLDADENVRELAVVHGSALVYLIVNRDVSARDRATLDALKGLVVGALTHAPR